jgi:hypothetical protein
MAEAAPVSLREQPEPPLLSPSELGPLVSEHPAAKSLTVVAFVAGPTVALTGLLFIVVAFDPSKSDSLVGRVFVVLFGLALLGLAVAVGAVWWRKRKTVLRVYRNGLVQQVAETRRVILWKDVATSKFVNGGGGAYNISSLVLKTHDGFKLSLNGQHVQGVGAIAALVASGTAALSVQAVRETPGE